MENLTPNQILNAAVVVLAAITAIITIDKLIDIIKKWKAPSMDVQQKLAADKSRLDKHDAEINNLNTMVNALCRAEMAHLQHEITGNSVDKLKEALAELTNALLNRE